MRLLVTNDDGIDSPGLHVLAERMTEFGEVTVFAPSGEYSGAGAAIGHIGAGIAPVYTVDRPELPGVTAAHHFDGPPALATLLACRGLLGPAPDVVVSGINPGWNVGHAVHFSGTIGAGITAGAFGIPAIAVSQHTGADQQWAAAAEAAARLVPDVVERPRLLNVNLANLPWDDLKGFKQADLSDRVPYGMRSTTLGEPGPDGGRPVSFGRGKDFTDHEGVDTRTVNDGYISVTELASTRAATSQLPLAFG